jgi:hypothetical protein
MGIKRQFEMELVNKLRKDGGSPCSRGAGVGLITGGKTWRRALRIIFVHNDAGAGELDGKSSGRPKNVRNLRRGRKGTQTENLSKIEISEHVIYSI